MTEERGMALVDHLKELRKRFILSLWGVAVGFICVYGYAEEIYALLAKPLCQAFKDGNCAMVYTSLVEPFMVYLQLGIVGGLFVSIPWILFQAWQFVGPGLHAHEKKWAAPFIVGGSLMFVVGGAVGYFFIFPFAFEYFLHLTPMDIKPMLSMDSYFQFSIGLLFAFGVLFEIPLAVVLLNALGFVSSATLWRTWRYGVVIIFILSAILTPADPYTMMLLAVPLTTLYFGSLLICSAIDKVKPEV